MLEKITTSCEYVSANSKHVSINVEKIKELVKNIDDIKMEHWLSSSPFGLLDLPVETIINFLLVYEAIDFSFWGNPKWTIGANNKQLDGSIALLFALLNYVKINKTFDFQTISEDEFASILKGNIKIPLFQERLNIIKEVSRTVNEKMNSNFYKYIKEITTDIELFNLIIRYFPNFKDERLYNGEPIYFYKLAQLLTSDILHIREIKEQIRVDYSHLIGCADYKIPQVLRSLGILNYDEELAQLVDSQIELPVNSEYEIEIRANMITVINIINRLLKNRFNRIDINDFLFMKKSDKSLVLKPYHLTRNTNY
ncbi:MAG: queuosine salvage family protein [Ruminococcus sp.]|nr:queuosine salvage family protein [Ruminococcus sp.]